MGYFDRTTLDRPARGPGVDAEIEALYSLLIVVSAAKQRALKVMRDYPEHALACQAIADFATDGEGDIRGALAAFEEEVLGR